VSISNSFTLNAGIFGLDPACAFPVVDPKMEPVKDRRSSRYFWKIGSFINLGWLELNSKEQQENVVNEHLL
jgi:hypothetical protein